MVTLSPISAISKLTRLNKNASTVIFATIAVFSAISIIKNLNIDIETSILVATYTIGIGAFLIIVANIINDNFTKLILGYTLTACFCVVAICFVSSALFRDQGIINPTYCLVRFWEKCDIIVSERNSQTVDSPIDIPLASTRSTAATTSSNYKVFIQFAGLTRESIKELNAALKKSGWKVQSDSGERILAAAGLNEVRYRNSGDKDSAEALANAITASRLTTAPVTIKQLSIIGPGSLEVWISN
ncbi:hypothetical protein [Agrobacterium tumefaciens]|uniref:hypothetical protein n=1 Tax=Agrobacterium tumefaciens TaxID=358 RepID=UPI000ABC6AE4|nr:hypothetical protein [Agrobacterium tumefaciens]